MSILTDEFTLDDLLKEAVAAKEDEKRLKEARKIKKTNRNISGDLLAELDGDIKRIEAAREWLAVADVAMFTIQECSYCGNVNCHFTGRFTKSKHRHQRGLFRWIAATPEENRGLPKEIKNHETVVPMCHFCADEQGFDHRQINVEFYEEQQLDDEDATDDLETIEDTPEISAEEPQDDAALAI